MAFRRAASSNSTSYPYSTQQNLPSPTLSGSTLNDYAAASPTSPTMRKRQRTMDIHSGNSTPADPPQPATQHHPVTPTQGQPTPVTEDGFINDNDAVDSAPDDDDEEEKPNRPADKKAGRRKIKIEFIQDKSRRHITFSKRKAGNALLLSFPPCLYSTAHAIHRIGIMKKVHISLKVPKLTNMTDF